MARREHGSILADLLETIDGMVRDRTVVPNLNYLAVHANLPFDRLERYIREAAGLGLVSGSRVPRLTLRGHLFLDEYRHWCRVLQEYGVSGEAAAAPAGSEGIEAPATPPGPHRDRGSPRDAQTPRDAQAPRDAQTPRGTQAPRDRALPDSLAAVPFPAGPQHDGRRSVRLA